MYNLMGRIRGVFNSIFRLNLWLTNPSFIANSSWRTDFLGQKEEEVLRHDSITCCA